MFKSVREFFNSLSDAQQAITTIVGVVVMATAGWATALHWLQSLDVFQKIFYSIAMMGLLFIFIIAFITWWRKHDVDNIPNYLCQLDEIVRDYVNNLKPETLNMDDLTLCTKDLGELWHINVNGMIEAFNQKDRIRISKFSSSASNQFTKMIDPKDRSNSALKNLLAASGIMDYHGVGLDVIKKTEKYQKLFAKVKRLQLIVPSAETSIKINEYLKWADGLYSILLGYRLIMDKPEVLDLLPAGERASTSYVGREIEGSTANIISAVRESLDKTKQRTAK